MADKAVVVIAFPNEDIESFRTVLQKVKPLFEGQEEVSVYGAVGMSAEAIIEALDEANSADEG